MISAATAVGAHGKPSADDLAHRGEVRGDSEVSLGTAVTDAEARHHLVKDEKCAVLLGEFTQTLEKTRLRLNESGIANDGLEDHTGDGIWVFCEQLP